MVSNSSPNHAGLSVAAYQIALALLLATCCFGEEDDEKADLGQFFHELKTNADRMPRALSYLARDWQDRKQWRVQARAKMHDLLSYQPLPGPRHAEVLETTKRKGYTRLLVRYHVTASRRTEAFLLIPDDLKAPAPAVIAIHDHGGFYYFGKEKITETDHPPKVLTEFIERSYGGRCYADDLARRGFIVLVPDGFYFGSQRLDPTMMSERFTDELAGLDPSSDDYIRKFNRIASAHETLTARTIFTAGTTWPGVLFQGDRASLDYLLTRPEVDPGRIGCIGLSIGGFRSAHLAGLDPRIKAAVAAGWMTTYDALLKEHLRNHTWMIYVPGQLRYLDLPDVASLNAPRPLMVINCLQDRLFTVEGMQAAEHKLKSVYEKMSAKDSFECRYYNVPHCLNVEMQDDAINWLERKLK